MLLGLIIGFVLGSLFGASLRPYILKAVDYVKSFFTKG